jgi:UDP-glucose:(glucosyl)LPS alpha-1,2-glucosyltransferase
VRIGWVDSFARSFVIIAAARWTRRGSIGKGRRVSLDAPNSAEPLVAAVLPPREGFGPGQSGAIGLIARRRAAIPGFRTVIVGGAQLGPTYSNVAFHVVEPALWHLGNINMRYVTAMASWLRREAPALIEVHNRPEIALRLARRFPATPVTLLLNNDPQEMRASREPAERAVLLRELGHVMTSSGYLRDRFLEGTGAARTSVAVLPNCIDLAEMLLRDKENLILFAGRVVAEKGTDVFAAACAAALPQLPGWRAEIIGADRSREGGPDTDFMRGVRATAETAGIAMPGYRDYPAVLDAMARAAIVVVPSRWAEPFGLTALEALGAGAALVVSHRGGLPEIGGDAAVYIDPEDARSLASTLVELARDPARRDALADAGRRRARLFDAPVIAAQLASLRRDVLAGMRPPRVAA